MPQKRRWPWEVQGAEAAHRAAEAYRIHQRRRWLTVFLPLLLAALPLLAGGLWVVLGASPATVAHGSAVVVIFLSVMCLTAGLPFLALLVALIVGTGRVYRATPTYTGRTLQTLLEVRRGLQAAADKTAAPVIRWQTWRAAWQAVWRTLRKGGSSA